MITKQKILKKHFGNCLSNFNIKVLKDAMQEYAEIYHESKKLPKCSHEKKHDVNDGFGKSWCPDCKKYI